MLIAQQPTACDAFHAHPGKARQRALIVEYIALHGGDWSIGELAYALGLQKSTVSARINECLNETGELVERSRRKDRISRITIRPVGLPVMGQQELFSMAATGAPGQRNPVRAGTPSPYNGLAGRT